MIRKIKLLTPEVCRERPDSFFVFGDNIAGYGKGGQAVIRGEPNAIGIPTKWEPNMKETSFFTDDSYNAVWPRIEEAFGRVEDALATGHDVFWPEDGIGTGRAELHKRATLIYRLIERRLTSLIWKYGLIP